MESSITQVVTADEPFVGVFFDVSGEGFVPNEPLTIQCLIGAGVFKLTAPVTTSATGTFSNVRLGPVKSSVSLLAQEFGLAVFNASNSRGASTSTFLVHFAVAPSPGTVRSPWDVATNQPPSRARTPQARTLSSVSAEPSTAARTGSGGRAKRRRTRSRTLTG